MENFKSLKSYWRRSAHQSPENSPAAKKMCEIRLGDGGRSRRRRQRTAVVRYVAKLKKLSIPAPRNVMTRLRDAYVDAMLLLSGGGGGAAAANKNSGGRTVWDRRIPRARERGSTGGDFEKRMLLHLYSSVIATH